MQALNEEAGALDRLRRQGATVHASLERLTVKLPDPEHSWMSSLGGVLLLVCGLGAPIQVLLLLAPGLQPLFWASVVVSLLCWVAGHVLILLPELGATTRRPELTLTPRLLQLGGHTVPLEEIRAVRLKPRVDVAVLIVNVDGTEVPLVRSGRHQMLVALRDLVGHHVRRVQRTLQVQGHSLARTPHPPKMLERLRQIP
ncbi:MAG: hypothetical protein AAFV53_28255 [Myxococcota bacterium]